VARARGALVPAGLQKRGRPSGAPARLNAEPSPVAVDGETLGRWRRDPVAWVRECLRHPDTGEVIELFPLQEAWFRASFTADADGRLPASETLLLTGKKSGKSFLNGLGVLYTTVVLGGRRAESYIFANDLQQAASRVYQACCELVAASPFLRHAVEMTSTRLYFPATQSFLQAMAADPAGAAGAVRPVAISHDEIWAVEHARAKRLFAEVVPIPNRHVSIRICTSYPGWVSQSPILEAMHARALKGEELSPGIYRNKRLLMAWFRDTPVAPWQDDAWRAEMREALGEAEYRRMVCAEFVASSSIFLSQDDWDAVEDASLRPLIAAKALPVWVGADFSLKHDSSCLAVVTWDAALQKVRLVDLKIWQPAPDAQIDFGETFVRTLLELKERFSIRSVTYDPYQLAFAAQTCTAAGLNMVELPQSEKNLTDATTSLFTLVKGRNFVTYPDAELRKAIAHTVVKQTGRGWRLSKEKRQHKIDPVVALSFSCMAAEKEGPTTGDGADYIASANLGPRRGASVSLVALTGERPDYDNDPDAYIRDSRLEQAEWRRSAVAQEFGADGSADDAAIPFEGDYGSRRWRDGF